jgi:hypothetical protein
MAEWDYASQVHLVKFQKQEVRVGTSKKKKLVA